MRKGKGGHANTKNGGRLLIFILGLKGFMFSPEPLTKGFGVCLCAKAKPENGEELEDIGEL